MDPRKTVPTVQETRLHSEDGSSTVARLKGGEQSCRRQKRGPIMLQDGHAASSRDGVGPIKWRRGNRDNVVITDTCTDPGKLFSTETWGKVFSFVGAADVVDAGRLHATTRSVSRSWRETFDNVMGDWDGLLHANLNIFAQDEDDVGSSEAAEKLSRTKAMIEWMLQCRVNLCSLSFQAGFHEVPILIKTLERCGTGQLTKMCARLDTVSALMELANEIQDTYGDRQRQKPLHDAIAANCPKLADLSMSVAFPTSPLDFSVAISQSLFSLPTITKLKIHLDFVAFQPRRVVQYETRAFSILIKDLCGLRDLEDGEYVSRSPDNDPVRYLIESDCLERLDASSLSKRGFTACKCPNLEEYKCRGNRNGVVPRISRADYLQLQRMRSQFSGFFNARTGSGESFEKGSFDIPFMEVPDSCRITLSGFLRSDWLSVKFSI